MKSFEGGAGIAAHGAPLASSVAVRTSDVRPVLRATLSIDQWINVLFAARHRARALGDAGTVSGEEDFAKAFDALLELFEGVAEHIRGLGAISTPDVASVQQVIDDALDWLLDVVEACALAADGAASAPIDFAVIRDQLRATAEICSEVDSVARAADLQVFVCLADSRLRAFAWVGERYRLRLAACARRTGT